MEIRELKKDDLNELAMLYKDFWNEESDILKMRDTYKEIDGDKNHIILNAIDNNRVIGTISGIICKSLYGDNRPFMVIEDFIVDENKRGNGIGKKLLSAMEEEGRNRGCCQVILVTDTDRKDSQKFYKSCGYPEGKNVGYKKVLK